MSRPGVTYHDIVTAANQLKGQGKNITIENIRAFLGTGSIGTINKYLKQWREAQESTHKIASKENLPENLVALVKGLWEGVVTQSAERFNTVEEGYKQEIAELKAELSKYQTNNQRWQKLFNQWQQEKLQLENEKLTSEQALAFAHKENGSLLTKCDGLSQQLQEKQARVEELHRLHNQVQQNLEHYRESAREQRLLDQQQFEREKQQLQIEIKTLQEQGSMQREKMTALQQDHQIILNQHSVLEEKYHETEFQLRQVKENIDILEKANYELNQSKQHWKNQYLEQNKLLENKITSLIEMQAELKLLSQKIADTKQSLNDLFHQNRLLTDDKLQLLQEKADLQGQLKQLQKAITV